MLFASSWHTAFIELSLTVNEKLQVMEIDSKLESWNLAVSKRIVKVPSVESEHKDVTVTVSNFTLVRLTEFTLLKNVAFVPFVVIAEILQVITAYV